MFIYDLRINIRNTAYMFLYCAYNFNFFINFLTIYTIYKGEGYFCLLTL